MPFREINFSLTGFRVDNSGVERDGRGLVRVRNYPASSSDETDVFITNSLCNFTILRVVCATRKSL